MNLSFTRITCAVLAGSALLAGCDTLQPLHSPPARTDHPAAPAPAPKPVVATSLPPAQAPSVSADQIALKEGIDLYNKGAYSEAIKRLGAPEMANAPKANQVLALKYTAFSYCVSSRQAQCRLAFDKAFKLDPAFDLQPGEHGHPLWGPVFAKAKKAK